MDIFLLGAGRPARGWKPSALKRIALNTRAMDWQLKAFGSDCQIHYLGGYHVDDVVSSYPHIHYTIIPDWETKGPLHTCLQAPFSDRPSIVTYSDTVFRRSILKDICAVDADVVFGVDTQWQHRYEGRSQADMSSAELIEILNPLTHQNQQVEFSGLIHFNSRALDVVKSLDEAETGTTLVDLIHALQKSDLTIQHFDVAGQWAELNAPEDMTRFILGTKAETLDRLKPLVKQSHIGRQVSFTSESWRTDADLWIQKIKDSFEGAKLVVRSSSKAEDGWSASNAGGFTSLLNIDGHNQEILKEAIQTVIASYGDGAAGGDQVLIQEFIEDVSVSGVVFTCGLETGSPYYRFNFDDTTSSTESVTSGLQGDLRTVIVSRFKADGLESVAPALCPVLKAVQELEEILGYDKLDIEFAVDTKGTVHIFQVRPITVDHSAYEVDESELQSRLLKDVNYFTSQQRPTPFVYGSKTLFGNMPDWNPAEIIGTNPKPLAFSLYRHLITNEVWATQRCEFGYRDIRPHPLISGFSGHPYVDARASLNSFIPASLSNDAASQLAQAYIDILDANPHLHDKIEFEVAFTVWTPTFLSDANVRLQGLAPNIIKDLESTLKSLTRNALTRLENDIAPIHILEKRRQQIKEGHYDPVDAFFMLVDDCRRFGTLAFSHAARAGFVAASFLKSFVKSGILSSKRHEEFLRSFKTVAGTFEADKQANRFGALSDEILIDRYGHLRPGTYDLCSQAYWEDPEKYLLSGHVGEKEHLQNFVLSDEEQAGIATVLRELETSITPEELFQYFTRAIQSRESVKFEFTRNLSQALDMCDQLSQQLSIPRDDFTYLEYHDLEQFKLNITDSNDLRERIKSNKHHHLVTHMIELPNLIRSADDFYCFERHTSQPNFVTTHKAQASVAVLGEKSGIDLSGAIVLIPQADPGYDWLFGHKIGGLITQYGGANSHMSIRAAEIGLPAAIGVGDKLYESLSQMKVIELDCANKTIREVQ